MPNDLATEDSGDLTIVGGGLKIGTDRTRDRNLIINRILTIRGEVRGLSFLGVDPQIIGLPIDDVVKPRAENFVKEALMIDPALSRAAPTVRCVILARNRIAVFVQSNRRYGDEERLTVVGSFWNRDELITKLDGSEG